MKDVIITQIDSEQLSEMIEISAKKGMQVLVKKFLPEKREKEEELLTRNQVADIIKCSTTTLWHWDKKSILKPIRLGRLVRYKKSTIDNFINQRENNSVFLKN
ncbi:MAG: helix-turn-helix domain-containing protein [Flavobacteriaceae bacterium]|nr:helix-turn-helix domain-containing protein [Flavobacteriaceae bacterium]